MISQKLRKKNKLMLRLMTLTFTLMLYNQVGLIDKPKKSREKKSTRTYTMKMVNEDDDGE